MLNYFGPPPDCAVMRALPRIAELTQAEGLFVKVPMSSSAWSDEAAK